MGAPRRQNHQHHGKPGKRPPRQKMREKQELLVPGAKFVRVDAVRDGETSPVVALNDDNIYYTETLPDEAKEIAGLHMIDDDPEINCSGGQPLFFQCVQTASVVVAQVAAMPDYKYPKDSSALERAFSDLFNLAVATKQVWLAERRLKCQFKDLPNSLYFSAKEMDDLMAAIVLIHAEDESLASDFPTPLSVMRHAFVHVNADRVVTHLVAVLATKGPEAAREETRRLGHAHGPCPFNEKHEGTQWGEDPGPSSGGWPSTVN